MTDLIFHGQAPIPHTYRKVFSPVNPENLIRCAQSFLDGLKHELCHIRQGRPNTDLTITFNPPDVDSNRILFKAYLLVNDPLMAIPGDYIVPPTDSPTNWNEYIIGNRRYDVNMYLWKWHVLNISQID